MLPAISDSGRPPGLPHGIRAVAMVWDLSLTTKAEEDEQPTVLRPASSHALDSRTCRRPPKPTRNLVEADPTPFNDVANTINDEEETIVAFLAALQSIDPSTDFPLPSACFVQAKTEKEDDEKTCASSPPLASLMMAAVLSREVAPLQPTLSTVDADPKAPWVDDEAVCQRNFGRCHDVMSREALPLMPTSSILVEANQVLVDDNQAKEKANLLDPEGEDQVPGGPDSTHDEEQVKTMPISSSANQARTEESNEGKYRDEVEADHGMLVDGPKGKAHLFCADVFIDGKTTDEEQDVQAHADVIPDAQGAPCDGPDLEQEEEMFSLPTTVEGEDEEKMPITQRMDAASDQGEGPKTYAGDVSKGIYAIFGGAANSDPTLGSMQVTEKGFKSYATVPADPDREHSDNHLAHQGPAPLCDAVGLANLFVLELVFQVYRAMVVTAYINLLLFEVINPEISFGRRGGISMDRPQQSNLKSKTKVMEAADSRAQIKMKISSSCSVLALNMLAFNMHQFLIDPG